MSQPLRYCASGNHMQPLSKFRVLTVTPTPGSPPRYAKNCNACEAKRKAPMFGVDIDRVHALAKANPNFARRR